MGIDTLYSVSCSKMGCEAFTDLYLIREEALSQARELGWQREIRECGEDPDEILHWCPAHLQPGGSWETD